jgi:hypothetical protein
MGYRKVRYLEQIWYAFKHTVAEWLEWQDAKSWAAEYHYAWLHIAKKAKCKEVRKIYRDKILKAYRGYNDA